MMRYSNKKKVRVCDLANQNQMCELRKKAHLQKSYTPTGSSETIAKGVYYLEGIDDMFRRKYSVKA